MSDDLPNPERLRRIERGVQQRIDRRRQAARRIAGASVAVVLVAGGVALVRPVLSFSGGSSASSAGGSSAERSATVVCHDSAGTRTIRVAVSALPDAAIADCARKVPGIAPSHAAQPNTLDETATPSPLPTPVLCETAKGVLHVYLASPAPCAAYGQDPVRG